MADASIAALAPGAAEDRARTVALLLERETVRLSELAESGNNRLYRVDHDGPPLVAKWYLDEQPDGRDRQDAEWAFLRYAEDRGLCDLPRPVGRDSERRVTVMSMVEGHRIGAAPTAEQVDAVGRFVAALNAGDRSAGAGPLPDAAEAAFSLAGHDEILGARLRRIDDPAGDAEQIRALTALRGRLAAARDRWREKAARWCDTRQGGGMSDPLPARERCVSPSDLGFHNALVGGDGTVRFVDFEYAGWDDPAKLICDFFWQPARPVDRSLRAGFADRVLHFSREKALHRARADILDPLFGLRWCCIILNPCLPGWAERRGLAGPGRDLAVLRHARIARAAEYLDRAEAMLSP